MGIFILAWESLTGVIPVRLGPAWSTRPPLITGTDIAVAFWPFHFRNRLVAAVAVVDVP